jgi:hypothetical protein
MDILALVMENSQLILMVIAIVMAIVAKYFGSKAQILADALQSIVDLEQEFLTSIRDGVISQQELDQILAKIQAASAALKAAYDAFITQPVPLTQKIAIVLGGGDLKLKVAQVQSQVQSMKLARMSK